MNRSIKLTLLSCLVTLGLILQTGCLKTRAQVKDGGDEESSSSSNEDSRSTPPKVTHYEIEEMKNEITRISGKLDQMEYNQKANATGDLKDSLASLSTRVTDLEKNQLLMMSEIKALKDKQTEEVKISNTSSKTLLADGDKLLQQKKYPEAAEKFHAVIAKNSKGKDAAEAHFGIGEAEYGQKNYKKAIVEYSKVQDVYAQSTLVPSSLYRIGMSFSKINMQKEARGFFAELVDRYPKSAEAKKARTKIKEQSND